VLGDVLVVLDLVRRALDQRLGVVALARRA
jgi:hypothetical protein